MKTAFFLLIVIFLGDYTLHAQCSPSVTVIASSNANGPVASCQPVIDTFWALPDSAGSSSTYNWYVNGSSTSAGTDSFLICSISPGNFANFQLGTYVEVRMTAGCNSFNYYGGMMVNPMIQNFSFTQSITRPSPDSVKVTYYTSSYSVDSLYIGLYYEGSSFSYQSLSFAISPQGTAQNPAIDSFSVMLSDYGSFWSVLQTVDTVHGCSATFLGDTVNNITTTGVSDVMDVSELKVQPNPVHDNLTVTCSVAGISEKTVTITNMLGQTIYTSQFSNGSLPVNTQNWQSGVYFVTVSSGNTNTIVKVVK